jgi:hypothetical protein
MARFVARLNHEIQDILEYKDYTNITHLFHFPCNAQRKCKVTTQVQRLIFLQEEQIHGSTTMYVQPHRLCDAVDSCQWELQVFEDSIVESFSHKNLVIYCLIKSSRGCF